MYRIKTHRGFLAFRIGVKIGETHAQRNAAEAVSILWILRAAGCMVEVGMPCIFEMGMVGMLGAPMVGNVGAPMVGFWGAMGNLGNLARAASISSLLIIAFVAALTCLGAIWISLFL